MVKNKLKSNQISLCCLSTNILGSVSVNDNFVVASCVDDFHPTWLTRCASFFVQNESLDNTKYIMQCLIFYQLSLAEMCLSSIRRDVFR